MKKVLIAPCGMNCALCRAYHSQLNNIKGLKHCVGCIPRRKNCIHGKGLCEKLSEGSVRFCFQCESFPCARLKRLDKRYRSRYDMSMIENQLDIRDNGVKEFLKKQKDKYRCPGCHGFICVHTKKCYNCDDK